jgi:hypothetical protein
MVVLPDDIPRDHLLLRLSEIRMGGSNADAIHVHPATRPAMVLWAIWAVFTPKLNKMGTVFYATSMPNYASTI